MDEIKELFAINDRYNKALDERGVLFVETMILLLERRPGDEQSYAETHWQTDQDLRYLEERIKGLRDRFDKLPAP
jgi:hypothetical protein